MAFKLFLANDLAGTDYGKDAHYRFSDQGLLIIEPGDGRQMIFSPHAWTCIDDPEPGDRMHVLSGDHTP